MLNLLGIFSSGVAFNLGDFFKHGIDFALMDEAKVGDVGHEIAKIARVEKKIEEILGGSGSRGGAILIKNRLDGVLGLMADNTRSGFGVGEVEIADENFVGIEHSFGEDSSASEAIGGAAAIMIDEAVNFENKIIEIW